MCARQDEARLCDRAASLRALGEVPAREQPLETGREVRHREQLDKCREPPFIFEQFPRGGKRRKGNSARGERGKRCARRDAIWRAGQANWRKARSCHHCIGEKIQHTFRQCCLPSRRPVGSHHQHRRMWQSLRPSLIGALRVVPRVQPQLVSGVVLQRLDSTQRLTE